MKKFFLLATAAMLVTGVTFADNSKKGKKKKAKMSCTKCSHPCKDKSKCAKM